MLSKITAWISSNPEMAAFAIFGLGMLLQKMASVHLSQYWARFFGFEKKHRFVTHEELNECVGSIQIALAEIKTELTKGSDCFDRIGESTRTLADIAHSLCQVVQPLTDTDLGCDDLKKFIREEGLARRRLESGN